MKRLYTEFDPTFGQPQKRRVIDKAHWQVVESIPVKHENPTIMETYPVRPENLTIELLRTFVKNYLTEVIIANERLTHSYFVTVA